MRWLHLCDLHVGKNDQAQAVAMRQLVNAIDEAVLNKDLDLVLFTGDLAFSGISDEYETLKSELLEPLRSLSTIKQAKFVSVPGNHDLDCNNCSHPLVWDSLGKSRQDVFWNFDDQGQRVRSSRASGFQAYSNFIKKENIYGLDPTYELGSRYVIGGSRNITLICLNTALFSDKDFSEEKERGNAPIPIQPLRALVKPEDSSGLIIVMGHHPVEWFEAQSRRHFLSALRELSAIYLHGHEHKIEADFSSHALRTLGFGAGYPGRLDANTSQPYTSTFAICELHDELHVKFVAWEPRHGVWRPFHAVQSDFDQESALLSGGYEVPVPTSRANSPVSRRQALSKQIRIIPKLQTPIWIEGDTIKNWTSLLLLLDLISQPYSVARHQEFNVGIYSSFLIKDKYGHHLIHASSAETAIVAYDHVEHVNTSIDTLKLDSCIIITLGRISESATNLANSLRQRKQIKVFGGSDIAQKLSESDKIRKNIVGTTKDNHETVIVPLVIDGGIALLLADSIRRSWYKVVDIDGSPKNEFDVLVNMIREKLPELKSAKYVSDIGISQENNKISPQPFDRDSYLVRCLKLFDTAKYAGLAAVGVKLPVESLRQIYVPTAANVEHDHFAVEATNRAIEELVQALGLDEHQRAQLTRQMKESYGAHQTSEVNAAGYLYQTFGNIIVLGDPGSGKSCFVRSEIMAYCEPPKSGNGDWYSLHVPVFLPLAEFAGLDENTSLLDYCVTHARNQGLSLSRIHLDILLSRGKIALFLDGLDEISSIAVRQEVIGEVNNLVKEFAPLGNRFVLTSRPAAIRDVDVPIDMARLTLQGLTDIEIKLLATRLFQARYPDDTDLLQADKEVIKSILQDCQSKPGIRRLARNPLLLTLLVFIYENSGPSAARRHLIYSQAVKTLVTVRHRDIRQVLLSEADLRTHLGRLAVAIFRRKTPALPNRKEVADVLINLDKTSESVIDFIQEVAENTGLLLVHPRTENKAEDLVSFMHHSFLEYYTALGFIEEGDGIRVVAPFALLTRWYEIVTLMFGILGEQTDITHGIKILCEQQSESDFITTSRIALAFDCAMECDVPPEATQIFLADELHKILSKGAGIFVSDVREDLARKVRILLENTGSKPIKKLLLGGIASDDAEVAAAYVHLVSKMGAYSDEDTELLDALTQVFQRKDKVLQLSALNALRDLPSLRSTQNLNVVRHMLLRGGIVEKSTALQFLEEIPSLIGEFSEEVIDILHKENSDSLLALTAASCVLRGGLPQRQESRGQLLLDAALEVVTRSDGPRQSLLGKLEISWEDLEEWIYSDNTQNKLRGYRSLVTVEKDAVKVHRMLFSSLRREKDSITLSTILDSLATYPAAIRAASLADTDLVCSHSRSKYRNVRTAAVRALRSFPSMQIVTDALIERLHASKGQYTEESLETIRSMAMHAVHDKSCRLELEGELNKILHNSNKWQKHRRMLVSSLLIACDQAAIPFDVNVATNLLKVVKDFRTPTEVRHLAIKFFGQICEMNSESAENIVKEFSSLNASRRLAAYRAADRFLRRCRGRIQTVQSIANSLEQMKVELIISWRRESGPLADKFDSVALREVRICLMEIESTLNAYNEFAERMPVDSATNTS